MRKGINISHVNMGVVINPNKVLKVQKKVSPFQIDIPKSHNDDKKN